MNYLQPDNIVTLKIPNISSESDYYGIWEKQQGNCFWTETGFYRIIFPGIRNQYSGPDYFGAVIQYPNMEIIKGDVELHQTISDWYSHNHHRDPQYTSVILHVVTRGKASPVLIGKNTTIPTIKLAVLTRTPSTRQCLHLAQQLSWKEFVNWIEVFASLRWEYLRSFFKGGNADTQKRILAFMDIKSNLISVQKTIAYYFSLPGDTPAEIINTKLLQYAVTLSWNMGRKRPNSHPLKRIPFLIFLAQNYDMILQEITTLSPANLRAYLLQHPQFRETVPGKDYLTEILGNILYPLSQQTIGCNQFPSWFQLPVRPYGKFQRHLESMGYTHKLTFGIQQGLIELNLQLCGRDLCCQCPFTHIEFWGNN